MVGGRVVGLSRDGDDTQVIVREVKTWLPDRPLGKLRAKVGVIEREDLIRIGDSLWWQGNRAYWTPKPDDGRADIPLERTSYSQYVETIADSEPSEDNET